jgi:hypothetical protein
MDVREIWTRDDEIEEEDDTTAGGYTCFSLIIHFLEFFNF